MAFKVLGRRLSISQSHEPSTTKMLIKLLLIIGGLFICDIDGRLIGYNEDSFLNFTQLGKKYGNIPVPHTVTTEDGYILTVYRMSMGANCDEAEKKPPVLITHGLMVSASIWLHAGPEAGLAYLLPEACYDLWCLTNRGGEDSRGHVKYNWKTDDEYWNFSLTELGTYDLPAVIDYILNNTNSKKLHYIGHSQGGSIFYMLGSERPEYLDKVAVSVTMDPATWLYHSHSELFKILASQYEILGAFAKVLGLPKVFLTGGPIRSFVTLLCHTELLAGTVCEAAYELIGGKLHGSMTARSISTATGHLPDVTCVKLLTHFGQLFDDNFYRQYNYGEAGNLKVYGKSSPPDYEVGGIQTPICILYGKNDKIISPIDVQILRDHLGDNVILYKQMDDENWNHLDFALSKNTRQDLLPIIVKCLSYKKE